MSKTNKHKGKSILPVFNISFFFCKGSGGSQGEDRY